MKIRAGIIVIAWLALLVLMVVSPSQICGAEVLAALAFPVVAWKFYFYRVR